MRNTNAEHLSALNHMRQELENANRMIANLESNLNLKELRDQEIEKLKKKAEEFEEYIRTNNTRCVSSGASSFSNHSKADASTETSDIDTDVSRMLRQAETKIRDEIAKVFAGEMKLMEKKYREDVEQLQSRIILITEDFEEKAHEVNVRAEQLQFLRSTILQEREEFGKSLKQKDDDFKVAIEKYRVEYENNQKKVEELMDQLNEKKELIDEERLSMERLKEQINEERKSLAKREEETLNKLKKLQLESTKAIEELHEKFKSAKKTAVNYKQFAEDKEKHYRNECERLKIAYTELIEKAEKRFKETLTNKERSHQEKMKKLETEFEFKTQVYKEMFEKRKWKFYAFLEIFCNNFYRVQRYWQLWWFTFKINKEISHVFN